MDKKTKQSNHVGRMAFPTVNPNAAGIDIGDLLIAVAVPQDRDQQPVREFGAFTTQLKMKGLSMLEQIMTRAGLLSTAFNNGGIWLEKHIILKPKIF